MGKEINSIEFVYSKYVRCKIKRGGNMYILWETGNFTRVYNKKDFERPHKKELYFSATLSPRWKDRRCVEL